MWILDQYLSHTGLPIKYSKFESFDYFLISFWGLKMITIGFLYGILTRVWSAFTALLMQCWKLELTETVNSNENCSFFELDRQNMSFKLLHWHIRKYNFFFFFFFCNLLTEPTVLSLINAPGALQFFKRGMFIRGKFSMQKCSG